MPTVLALLLFSQLLAAATRVPDNKCDEFDYTITQSASRTVQLNTDAPVDDDSVCRTNFILHYTDEKIQLRYVQQRIVLKSVTLDRRKGLTSYYKISTRRDTNGTVRDRFGLPEFACVTMADGGIGSLYGTDSHYNYVASATNAITFECDVRFEPAHNPLYDTMRMLYAMTKHFGLQKWQQSQAGELRAAVKQFFVKATTKSAEIQAWYDAADNLIEAHTKEQESRNITKPYFFVTKDAPRVPQYLERQFVPYQTPQQQKEVGALWGVLGAVIFTFVLSLAWAVVTIYGLTRPTSHCDSHKSLAPTKQSPSIQSVISGKETKNA